MASSIRNTNRRRAPRGFTLAESLIGSAVLGAAVAGIALPLAASHMQNELVQEASVAAALADQLMEEIASKSYAEPSDGTIGAGPQSDELSRADYDDVGDYSGYSDTTDDLRSVGAGAVTWSGGGQCRRSVSVEYRATRNGPPAASGDFALVTVTVRSPSGQSTQVARLMSRYALVP